MADSESEEGDSTGEDSQGPLPDWAVGLVTVEAIALLIGLAMPLTPSKTGSTWSFAELFWAEPSYLREVAVNVVMTNLLILVIGLGIWVSSKLRPRGSTGDS